MTTLQLGSRYRERTELVDPTLTMGTQTITVDGHLFGAPQSPRVPYWGIPMYDFLRRESCWDELHHREEVIKYYIKQPCRRRVYLSPDEAAVAKRIPELGGSLYAKIGHGKYFTSGGPFTLIRTDRSDEFTVKGRDVYIRISGPYMYKYEGGFLPTGFSNFGPSAADLYQGHALGNWSPAALQNGLEELGARAWNKARPKPSKSDILTFLGELRELPSMLKTTAKLNHDIWSSVAGKRHKGAPTLNDVPKEVANNFLNHAFGWAPFVGDLSNFYDTWKTQDQSIKQMLKDNGQWIKRRTRVDDDAVMTNHVVQSETNPWVMPTLHDWFYSPKGNSIGRTETFHESYLRTWFVGSFKYFIPRPPDNPDTAAYNRVMDLLRLYGVRLSPSVIWNLTPWSWLTDWFGNLGDIIDNIDAQMNDNLTARYAFIMRESRQRYVNDSTVYSCKGDIRMTWAREVLSKTRVEAHPFGFGLTGGGLNSNYRLAILAALGLTRRG